MPGFSPDLADAPEAGYRPLSGMAVTSLIFGCLSILTLFSPLALALPLVGMITAVLAIRELSHSDVLKVGRTVALAGMALSAGFASQSVASNAVTRWLKERRVEHALETFVQAVRNDDMTAVRSMLSRMLVPLPEIPEDALNIKPDPAVLDANARKTPIVVAIRRCVGDGKPAIACEGFREDSQEDKPGWLATITFKPCADGKEVVISVELMPSWVRDDRGYGEVWKIERYVVRD